jgi:hypothetical protein
MDATESDRPAVVGDECHIIAQGNTGPRAVPLPPEEVDDYPNLILLCRTHHKQVDDQPGTFTPMKLRDLKTAHERWVHETLGSLVAQGQSAHSNNETSAGTGWWGTRESLPNYLTSDQIFSARLSDAFPGSRGLTVIDDPKQSLDRLDILFRQPIAQRLKNSDGSDRDVHPLWWFRGPLNMFIDNYARLADGKCVIGWDELKIARVAAYRTLASSMWEFLYVESVPEPPSGVYEYPRGYVEQEQNSRAMGFFCSEEYAVWNGRAITREEYDDGAALIDGKPMPISGAEIRIRFLTRYNFLVCGNRHVINDMKADWEALQLLDGILRGTRRLGDLVAFIQALPKPPRYQGDDW